MPCVKRKIRLKLILPNSTFRNRWNTVILTVNFIFYIQATILFALPTLHVHAYQYWFTGIATLLFLADIFFNFNTAYSVEDEVIFDKKLIARRYLRSYFSLDLLTTLPLDLLALGIYGERAFVLLHLIRALRIFRSVTYFRKDDIIQELSVTHKLGVFGYWFFVTIHFITFGWMLICIHEPKQVTPPDIDFLTFYNRAFYWTVTTLTTVGYGDISPTTNIGRMFTSFVMMTGVALYGLVIGNVTRMLAKLDSVKAAQREKMGALAEFLNHYSIPQNIQKEVFKFYKHLLQKKLSSDDERIIADLPQALQEQIKLYINIRMIESVPMFSGQNEDCIKDLANSLEQMVVAPGEYIIRCGDIGNEMFFLAHGKVEVLTSGMELITQLGNGSFFGEIALLRETTRTAHVRSLKYCDIYCLKKEAFLKIMNRYPDFAKEINQAMESRDK